LRGEPGIVSWHPAQRAILFYTEVYFLQVKARILQNYFNNSPHSNDNLRVFPGNPMEVARKAPIRN